MTHQSTQPNFRSAAAHAMLAQTIFRGLYLGSPSAYLILSPDLRIIDGNPAYLTATMTCREQLVDRYMFDAFPDNPTDAQATGVSNLTASFQHALASMRRDEMPLQRYDVRSYGGRWKVRYWNVTNWPIADEGGSVLAVVHHVREAKAFRAQPYSSSVLEHTRQLLEATRRLVDELQDKRMETEHETRKLASGLRRLQSGRRR